VSEAADMRKQQHCCAVTAIVLEDSLLEYILLKMD
jgi:hypothetical protein